MAEEKKQIKTKKQVKPKSKTTTGLPKGKIPKGKFNFYWIYGIVAVIFIALTFTNFENNIKETDWGELKEMLAAQDVEKIIVVNREEAEIFIKQDKLNNTKYQDVKDSGLNGAGPHYTYNIGSYDTFKEDVEHAQEGLQKPIYIKNINRPAPDNTNKYLNSSNFLSLCGKVQASLPADAPSTWPASCSLVCSALTISSGKRGKMRAPDLVKLTIPVTVIISPVLILLKLIPVACLIKTFAVFARLKE